MTDQIITTLISTSVAVIFGLGGMWIGTNQLGMRIDDLAAERDPHLRVSERPEPGTSCSAICEHPRPLSPRQLWEKNRPRTVGEASESL
jgi:hypothetical protein